MGSSTKKMRLSMARLEMFAAAAPTCPKCESPMTPRSAKRGAGVEYRFWGCVAFPACLGIRPRR
jgi:ssDNA-binding Zn-finger/Zn-ribbon topoisomerase 1